MVCFLSHLFLVFLVDNSSYAFSPSNHSSKRPTRCHTAAFQTASNHHTNGEATSSNSSILKVPAHVAFICDGNSRWAKARRLPSVAGHAAGGNRLIQIVDALKRKGVSHATFYGFSTENWQRTASEVQDILKVLEGTARQFYGKALQDNLRIRILGDLQDERIPSGLRDILHRLEVDTGGSDDYMRDDNDDRLTLTIAINYGGRQDIVNASKRMALAIAREGDSLDLDTVTEETFATYLGTAGIPDPDFVIRTSGECRLSNFLLWNVAYAELYFVETLWPDFDEASLDEAFEWYAQRKRRFGARQMTKETSRA
jgi:undecaprenyl diphosphate synthase